MNTVKSFTTFDYFQFAAILRAVRADRSLRAYGRLGSFGRVLITDQFRVNFPAWTPRPPMNIHRQKEAV